MWTGRAAWFFKFLSGFLSGHLNNLAHSKRPTSRMINSNWHSISKPRYWFGHNQLFYRARDPRFRNRSNLCRLIALVILWILIVTRYFDIRFLRVLSSYDLLVLFQLSNESVVRHDKSSLLNVLKSLICGPSLLPYKVSDHDRGWSADTSGTVYQNAAIIATLFDKINRCLEMLKKVLSLFIFDWDLFIVKFSREPVGQVISHIQNVGHFMLAQQKFRVGGNVVSNPQIFKY